jgi:hypothetical protein
MTLQIKFKNGSSLKIEQVGYFGIDKSDSLVLEVRTERGVEHYPLINISSYGPINEDIDNNDNRQLLKG